MRNIKKKKIRRAWYNYRVKFKQVLQREKGSGLLQLNHSCHGSISEVEGWSGEVVDWWLS